MKPEEETWKLASGTGISSIKPYSKSQLVFSGETIIELVVVVVVVVEVELGYSRSRPGIGLFPEPNRGLGLGRRRRRREGESGCEAMDDGIGGRGWCQVWSSFHHLSKRLFLRFWVWASSSSFC